MELRKQSFTVSRRYSLYSGYSVGVNDLTGKKQLDGRDSSFVPQPVRNNFWSLDCPPNEISLPSSSRRVMFFICAGIQICCGIVSFIMAVFIGRAIASPSESSQFTNSRFAKYISFIFILSAVIGYIDAIKGIGVGAFTLYMLYSRMNPKSINIYKMDVMLIRLHCTVGIILSSVLAMSALGASSLICRPEWTVLDTATTTYVGDVCSSSKFVYGLIAVVIVSAFFGALPILLWRLGTYFNFSTMSAFARLLCASIAGGAAFHFLALHSVLKESQYYASLSDDGRVQLGFFCNLIFWNGFLCSVLVYIGAALTLFASWRRSKLYVAVDALISFLSTFFVFMFCSSAFYVLKLKAFFCDYEYFYTIGNGLTDNICKSTLAFAAVYVSITAAAIDTGVIFLITAACFLFVKLMPLEWVASQELNKNTTKNR